MAEQDHYAAAMNTFWQSEETAPPTKRQRKSYAEQPRMASLMTCRENDNALRHTLQRRLHSFVPQWDKLDEALASQTLTIDLLNKICPILSTVEDQASWQVCSGSFLKRVQGVNLVNLWDPAAHRVHNDWTSDA